VNKFSASDSANRGGAANFTRLAVDAVERLRVGEPSAQLYRRAASL
jgi:hypothetical protein